MALDLLYFGSVREAFGKDGERLDPPSHILTIEDLLGWLADRGEPYDRLFSEKERVRAAVDGELAGYGDSFFGAREVALFPPGGVL